MTKTALRLIVLSVVLVLLQVLGLKHICLWGVAMTFAYIYVIMHLPLTLSQNWCLTIGFFLGLVIDIFSDTPGVCSLSCTLMTALRRPVLKLYMPREEELTDPCPSSRALGYQVFLKYSLTLCLLYCSFVFVIEAFSFFSPLRLLLRIACSTLLTWLTILAIDTIISKSDEKGL